MGADGKEGGIRPVEENGGESGRGRFLTFKRIVLAAVLLLGLAAAVLFLVGALAAFDPMAAARENNLVLVAFAVILPAVGVPFSIFLFLLGASFGTAWGLVLTGAVIPVHLLASFALSHGLLKGPTSRLLARAGRKTPRLPPRHQVTWAFLFFALPGPPYFIKNVLLALAGVPFAVYLAIGWPVQFFLALPFVGLGDSAVEMSALGLAAYSGIMVALFFGIRFLAVRIRQPRP